MVKRSKGRSAGAQPYTDIDMKHAGWCLNIKVEVSISPDWKDDLGRWQIDISINGKIYTDP